MNRADLVAAGAALTKRSTEAQGIPARLENPVMLRRLASLFAAPADTKSDRQPMSRSAVATEAPPGPHGTV